MTTLDVDVVSAEELIFSGKAKFVALPGVSGELGILPQHTPLITLIAPGTVRIRRADNDREELIFVAGGLLEVQPDKVTVLADTAIRGEDLDEAKATAARKAAQDAVDNARGKMELAEAKAELALLAAQVAAIRKTANKQRD